MPSISVSGHTTRSILNKFKDTIIGNGHTMQNFSDQYNKKVIAELAWDFINIISGYNPYALLNSNYFISKQDRVRNMQPLNTVWIPIHNIYRYKYYRILILSILILSYTDSIKLMYCCSYLWGQKEQDTVLSVPETTL